MAWLGFFGASRLRWTLAMACLLLLVPGLGAKQTGPRVAQVPDAAKDQSAASAPMSKAQLRSLLRRSDVVARVRVVAFTPATYDRQTHRGTVEHTRYAVEEVLRGRRRLSSLDVVRLGPPEQGAPGVPVGTEMIVFARYRAREKVWEPADEIYTYAPSPQLKSMIVSGRSSR